MGNFYSHIDEDSSISCKRDQHLLHMIAAAGRKSILQVWSQPRGLTFHRFLDKLTYLMKMDWVEAAQLKEKRVKCLFKIWGHLFSLLPTNIKEIINNCLSSTTWFQEQVFLGNNLLPLSTL